MFVVKPRVVERKRRCLSNQRTQNTSEKRYFCDIASGCGITIKPIIMVFKVGQSCLHPPITLITAQFKHTVIMNI